MILIFKQVGSLDLSHVTRDKDMKQMLEKDPLRWRGGIKCKWAVAVHEALTVICIHFFKCRHLSSIFFLFLKKGNQS